MHKMLIAAVAVLGTAGTALAADLPVKAPPMVAPVPVFTWTGCYVGGYVGGAFAEKSVGVFDRDAYNGFPRDAWSYDLDSSVIGGGTAGCNYQPAASPFVVGFEGEVGYMRLTGSGLDPFDTNIESRTKIGDIYSLITGRVGYAWDRTMIYAKAGAAFVDVNTVVVDPVPLGTGLVATGNTTDATWTAGGGIEWAFDLNWSLKAEYMFIGLHGIHDACSTTFGFCWDHDIAGVHTAKVGINYRFGAPAAPVMARY